MVISKFELFGKEVDVPLRFDTHLEFPDLDRELYPWLAEPDRYYMPVKELGRGGFAVAVLGFACDRDGKRRDDRDLVIKIPNLKVIDFADEDIISRSERLSRKTIEEWDITRSRLRNCKFANPILDFTEKHVRTPDTGRLVRISLTVQLFLKDALPLDAWLVKRGLRTKPYRSPDGQVHESHNPIEDWEELTSVCYRIASAAAEIHDKRVAHGDIWPPNIFFQAIAGEVEESVKFIDFGESFGFIPTGDALSQNLHAYRAPERGDTFDIPTEAVDVYSLGMLLLDLALGRVRSLPVMCPAQKHRAFVTDMVFELNETLAKQYPAFIDLVVRCTAEDPINRPFMREVADELRDMIRPRTFRSISKADVLQRANAIVRDLEAIDLSNGFAAGMIEDRLEAVEHLIRSADSELVSCHDTRYQLIRVLVGFFNGLTEGDSWSAITSPAMWQSSALGLSGRYRTATIDALKRGVSVHRCFVITLEELGLALADQLGRRLSLCHSPSLASAGQMIASLIQSKPGLLSIEAGMTGVSSHDFSPYFQQFRSTISMLEETIDRWKLDQELWKRPFQGIGQTQGAYIGMIITPTINDMMSIRRENPASIVGLAKERDWLLVMTDISSRRPIILKEKDHRKVIPSRAELKRVRVYRSVQGYPKDRVKRFEDRMKNSSINIGDSLKEFGEVLAEIDSSLS